MWLIDHKPVKSILILYSDLILNLLMTKEEPTIYVRFWHFCWESLDTYGIIIERSRIISQIQHNFIRKYYTYIYFLELTFILVECHTKASQKIKNKKKKKKKKECLTKILKIKHLTKYQPSKNSTTVYWKECASVYIRRPLIWEQLIMVITDNHREHSYALYQG